MKPVIRNARRFKCEYCGKKADRIEIHHRKLTSQSNLLKAILFICRKCHKKIHQKKAASRLTKIITIRFSIENYKTLYTVCKNLKTGVTQFIRTSTIQRLTKYKKLKK